LLIGRDGIEPFGAFNPRNACDLKLLVEHLAELLRARQFLRGFGLLVPSRWSRAAARRPSAPSLRQPARTVAEPARDFLAHLIRR
jgi:hypothetical protein